jgi:DNA-binding NarL/FixJ family response regulator
MNPATVLLVDDHALFRRGVCSVVERDGDFQVVGEGESKREALALARELQPDLILIDIGLTDGSGLDAIRDLKRALPDTKIVVLTVHQQKEIFLEAIKGGAEGYLTKDVRAWTLLGSLRKVLRGEAVFSGHMVAILLREYVRLAQVEAGMVTEKLTCRERQVLEKISEGLSNKAIGDCLDISENTVRTHVSHILQKLHFQSRSQAAACAQQNGLLRQVGKL